MQSVLHYKTNFLNPSETFIHRLVSNHRSYKPSALCYNKRSFTSGLDVYDVPVKGIGRLINFTAFHLNLPLPYYDHILRKQSPSVIHSHFGYDAMKLATLARRYHIPHVVSFYGSDVSRLPKEFGWKRRYRKLARLGDRFIAASHFMRNQLITLGFPAEKIDIVRFGLDIEHLTYRQNYRLSNEFIMVGRMVEKKGFEFAIRAVSYLVQSGTSVTLNLFGDGPLMPKMKSLVEELKLNSFVHFHGYVPVNEIITRLAEHALLLAPSVEAADGDMEGLPNTILEAMAAGIPVIASYHAAIPEAIQHKKTGFLTKERDSAALAEQLKDILEGKYDLEQIRSEARKRIENEYSVTTMVQETEQIYSKLIAASLGL